MDAARGPTERTIPGTSGRDPVAPAVMSTDGDYAAECLFTLFSHAIRRRNTRPANALAHYRFSPGPSSTAWRSRRPRYCVSAHLEELTLDPLPPQSSTNWPACGCSGVSARSLPVGLQRRYNFGCSRGLFELLPRCAQSFSVAWGLICAISYQDQSQAYDEFDGAMVTVP